MKERADGRQVLLRKQRYSDPADAPSLLCPRRERPRRRAAERDNEFSPSDADCHMTLRRGLSG
jgi:hypothetical protein